MKIQMGPFNYSGSRKEYTGVLCKCESSSSYLVHVMKSERGREWKMNKDNHKLNIFNLLFFCFLNLTTMIICKSKALIVLRLFVCTQNIDSWAFISTRLILLMAKANRTDGLEDHVISSAPVHDIICIHRLPLTLQWKSSSLIRVPDPGPSHVQIGSPPGKVSVILKKQTYCLSCHWGEMVASSPPVSFSMSVWLGWF